MFLSKETLNLHKFTFPPYTVVLNCNWGWCSCASSLDCVCVFSKWWLYCTECLTVWNQWVAFPWPLDTCTRWEAGPVSGSRLTQWSGVFTSVHVADGESSGFHSAKLLLNNNDNKWQRGFIPSDQNAARGQRYLHHFPVSLQPVDKWDIS